MPRPSRKTDERLVLAAQDMLETTGFNRMNLRRVAREAGVNLGMFHYHFKTKDQFILAVLQDSYERFFKNFSLRIENEKAPLEKLRQAVFSFGQFARDNRRMILSLLTDVMNGNKVVLDFAKKNAGRHARVIWDLLGRCQKEGVLEKMPRPLAMVFLMTAVNAASLVSVMAENLELTVFSRGMLKGAQVLVLSDRALRKRVDMALKGMGAKEGEKRE